MHDELSQDTCLVCTGFNPFQFKGLPEDRLNVAENQLRGGIVASIEVPAVYWPPHGVAHLLRISQAKCRFAHKIGLVRRTYPIDMVGVIDLRNYLRLKLLIESCRNACSVCGYSELVESHAISQRDSDRCYFRIELM